MLADPSVILEGERPECGRLTEVTCGRLCILKSFNQPTVHPRETVDKTLIITVRMLCDSVHIIGNRYHFTVCNPNAQDTGQNHNITLIDKHLFSNIS